MKIFIVMLTLLSINFAFAQENQRRSDQCLPEEGDAQTYPWHGVCDTAIDSVANGCCQGRYGDDDNSFSAWCMKKGSNEIVHKPKDKPCASLDRDGETHNMVCAPQGCGGTGFDILPF